MVVAARLELHDHARGAGAISLDKRRQVFYVRGTVSARQDSFSRSLVIVVVATARIGIVMPIASPTAA